MFLKGDPVPVQILKCAAFDKLCPMISHSNSHAHQDTTIVGRVLFKSLLLSFAKTLECHGSRIDGNGGKLARIINKFRAIMLEQALLIMPDDL